MANIGIQHNGTNWLRKEQCKKVLLIPTKTLMVSFILQFIDNLTKSTKLAGTTLRSVTESVLAVRIQLFDEDIVLLDTPGFDNTYRSDVTILELIGEWLKTT